MVTVGVSGDKCALKTVSSNVSIITYDMHVQHYSTNGLLCTLHKICSYNVPPLATPYITVHILID